jgi:hypothetical protein
MLQRDLVKSYYLALELELLRYELTTADVPVSPIASGKGDSLAVSAISMSPCIVLKDDGYWNIRHTPPMSVLAIMILSPK